MVEARRHLRHLALCAAAAIVAIGQNVDVERLIWLLTLPDHQVQVILLVAADRLREVRGVWQTGRVLLRAERLVRNVVALVAVLLDDVVLLLVDVDVHRDVHGLVGAQIRHHRQHLLLVLRRLVRLRHALLVEVLQHLGLKLLGLVLAPHQLPLLRIRDSRLSWQLISPVGLLCKSVALGIHQHLVTVARLWLL